MTKFEVIILLVVYLKTNTIAASSPSADMDMFHHSNERILNIIDDLFISLKINNKIMKFKYAEDISRHTLIKDAIRNNHKKYKKVRDISKTKISNKTAYYISNINEVIEEMIRSEAVRNYRDIRNDNIYSFEDESVNDFVNLTRRFNLKLRTLATVITDPKLKGSKGIRQEEARRIFAGSSTGIARYPFMVSVHVAGRFVCAGSLVHESLALSAASCLMRTTVEIKPDIQIRVASDYVSKMGSLVNIEDLIFHPEFNRASLENNLVLLRTKKALRFRKRLVVAIQYDRVGESLLQPNVEDLVILGWGRRRMDEHDVGENDRPLSEGQLQLYDFDACQYIYTRDFVTDRSFCAGFVDRGAGACNHDGGGPALVNNVLVGVISFGSPQCGASEAPTVFTRLDLFADWIDGVFRKLAEAQGIRPEEQLNISENILREESYLDEAMKDVYRENSNVDDVLYGPIETLYDDEIANVSTKTILREYPTDPNMFPNPELVANVASPKTPKPIEPPEGYWKDVSIEETNSTNYDKLLADQLTANQGLQVNTETENIYADDDEAASITTDAIEQPFNNENTGKVNLPIFDSKYAFYESTKKTTKDSIPQESFYNNMSELFIYTKLSSENEITYKPDMEQPKDNIKNFDVNEKAVIVMSDSGTTQIIEVNKGDPLYHQGFKMLAAKVIHSKGV